MSNPQRRLYDVVTDPAYIEGLAEKSVEDLRAERDECREVENEISFERRLCHARIDILNAEMARREGAEGEDLLAHLPEILSDEAPQHSDAPLPERAPDLTIPRNADIPRRRVEEIVGERTLAQLGQLQVREIRNILANIREHESQLSARRRRVHEVIDEIQAEIVRRYQTGEADPTSALS
jgi:hypothetical protein